MPSLSDHIDRFASTAKSIRSISSSAANSSSSSGNAFTAAVLDTPLGDLIRDVDPSELGLFTLVPPAPLARHSGVREPDSTGPPAEVTRIEVVSATPLRKHPATRRDDAVRPKEPEPEVYAEAALKYLDRYSSIRPMPRAQSQVSAILEQLHEIRQNMESLNDALQQAKTSEPVDRPHSPRTMAHNEEERIQELRERIDQLHKRKEGLQRKRPALRNPMGTPKPTRNSQPPPSSRSPRTDAQEDIFWGTPGGRSRTPARTLQFNDLLVNEQVDLGDVTSSFASPISAVRPTSRSNRPFSFSSPTDDPSIDEPNNVSPEPEHVEEPDPDVTVQPISQDEDIQENEQDEEGDEADEAEKTVMLSKGPSPPPAAPPDLCDESEVEIVPPTPIRPRINAEATTPSRSARKPKVRITNEVERIVMKIWSTVGDIIMPGHPFDTSGNGVQKPPRAKETIKHLQWLSSQTPEPPSPTASSLSSMSGATAGSGQPNVSQILTAHMLLALLSAPPNFSVPLIKLKEVLNAKNAACGGTGVLSGQVSTRVLYGFYIPEIALLHVLVFIPAGDIQRYSAWTDMQHGHVNLQELQYAIVAAFAIHVAVLSTHWDPAKKRPKLRSFEKQYHRTPQALDVHRKV
ncbi:hypothetical protein EW146_g5302 [Bondarzewia mesenterica]|uniref:Uncharacterized protein n=1 Tax=Bondarzewia mesenterica TaxID=1095465 RepID=A0A4S4LT07_9AGAM|nr:hypothetical protein EW146_g5302 [Bondarzewia mesenterica]